MFNWNLFLLLFAVSIPGIIITVPSAVKTMQKLIPKEKNVPSTRVITALGILQSSILVLAAAAIGTALTPSIRFSVPFFESIVQGENIWNSLHPQLLPSLIGGISGGIIFVTAYYKIFRPHLDKETVDAMEELRMNLGLTGRIFYGGIVEEILTRWGLLSFVLWIGKTITGEITPTTIWIAIVIAGIIFGIGHLPSYVGAGCKKTPLFITLMVSLNLWASLIFGWLFWQYGLAAPMIAHMMFHIVWYPLDVRFSDT